MPEFTAEAEIDVDPSEFVDACTPKELQRLVEILEEDGYVKPSTETLAKNNGVRQPNVNDKIYWDSLNHLSKCRDLLTFEEEEYINKLAKKFAHLR